MMKHCAVLLLVALLSAGFINLVQNNGYIGVRKAIPNNNEPIDVIIKKRYTSSETQKMRELIEQDSMDLKKFNLHYDIQCLRKTHQGYYAVFIQDDEKLVFVFFNERKSAVKMLIIDEFKSLGEYDFIKAGETTQSDVLKHDENPIFLPFSAFDFTAHIIKEGLLVIRYNRMDANTGTRLCDPVIDACTFFHNDDFPLPDDPIINMWVPFILEFDKI